MSEVAALEPLGDFHSAFYFRDLYLRDETRYTKFFCPFCGVPLASVLIDAPANQELGKSPHFRTPPGGEKHQSGCDGNPSKYQDPTQKRPAKTSVLKCQFSLPTEFTQQLPRPEKVACGALVRSLSPDEIRRRREAAGSRYHVARFRVSLVQSLAEAHLSVLADAYRHKKERGWSDDELHTWVREILQAPINLRGFRTTYRNALHDLWFAVPQYPRVFYGRHGKVALTKDGYELTSERSGKIDDNISWPFIITVSLRDIDNSQLRGARGLLRHQLERAAEEGAPVRWYAYGRARLVGERFELPFDGANLGDLFVKLQKFSRTVR